MAWLLLDFAVLAVLLRAMILAFQSLVIGGLFFVAIVGLPARAPAQLATQRCLKGIWWAAVGLAITHLLYVAVNSAILMGTLEISLRDVITADYFLAGAGGMFSSIILLFTLRKSGAPIASRAPFLLRSMPVAAALLAASIWTSHSVSRLDHRFILAVLTGAHQLAVATWIGAMPFLLISLRVVRDRDAARFMARRFSTMAMVSVAGLITAGIGLSYFYVGSWPAFYGTAYGFMIITKSALLIVLLSLGATNWWLIRSLNGPSSNAPTNEASPAERTLSQPMLILRRIGEAELGVGFSIILAAASLTSQPPAVDLVQGRLTMTEIVVRVRPSIPRFSSPSADELAPPTPLEEAVHSFDKSAVEFAHGHRDADMAFSEASHHWAGLILLLIGIGAWLSRSPKFPWARYWPVGFAALSIYTFVRADPENWPLGPISFWKSFYDPEVLEHRLFDVLLMLYAIFELRVQLSLLKGRAAAYVFPLLMAAGGAVLLLHSHALGNVKDELLIEMSHNSMAVFAVCAGWARWVEVRLPADQDSYVSRIAAQVWPVCILVIGFLLLNYREA